MQRKDMQAKKMTRNLAAMLINEKANQVEMAILFEHLGVSEETELTW